MSLQSYKTYDYSMPKSRPSESNSITVSLARKNQYLSPEEILIKSIPITSIPVNTTNGIVYVPLVSGSDLELLRSSMTTFTRLDTEYKNLISKQSQIGLSLVSELSRRPLHPFKPEFNVYLIETRDCNNYVTYGELNGNKLFYS